MIRVKVFRQDAPSAIAQKAELYFTGTVVHFSQQLAGQSVRDTAIVASDKDGSLRTVAIEHCALLKSTSGNSKS